MGDVAVVYSLFHVVGDDFVDRGAEMSRALEAIRDHKHVAVVGERRIGKTSFLHELKRRLDEHIQWLEIQAWTGLDELIRMLTLAKPAAAKVLVCDELDSMVKDGYAPSDLAVRLREVAERCGYSLVLTGCTPLLPMLSMSSPSAWWGEVVELRPMEPTDIVTVLANPARGKLQFTDSAHYAAYDYCGGQPWLAKLLGIELVLGLNRSAKGSEGALPLTITAEHVERAAQDVITRGALRAHWQHLVEYHFSGDEIAALRRLASGGGDPSDEEPCARLEKRGYLEHSDEGAYFIRPALFERCLGGGIANETDRRRRKVTDDAWSTEEQRCWSALRRSAPEAVSYADLAEEAWPGVSLAEQKMMNQLKDLVWRLSAHMGDDPEAPKMVQELVGIGYCIVVDDVTEP